MKKNYLSYLYIGLLILSSMNIHGQIISQYVETNSGTIPKGVEIWNNTGSTLDFATNNLVVEKGTNGQTPSPDVTVSSGTLAPGAVMVIGTSNIGTYLNNQGLTNVTYVEEGFTFNGDDALIVKYGGTITDMFGISESDPGSSWSGNGVDTRNQNIRLIDETDGAGTGISTGDTDGWTDPSTRFVTVSSNPVSLPAGLEGFGIAPITTVWDGSSNTNWSLADNWSNGVPSLSSNVSIPSGLSNYPTATSALTVNSLTIASGATLVATDAGFTVTNNATYSRNLANGSQWYLMSSPVSEENYNNDWVTANSIPSSSQDTDNRGISWYDNSSSDTDSDGAGTSDSATGYWRYMEANDDTSFAVGRGYGVIRSGSGDIEFIGSGIYTSNQNFAVTQGENNFNLIGNPFTGFITLGTFYTTNSAVIGETFFTWNGSSYTTRLNNIIDSENQNFEIAPGQGFFVEASSAGNVTFEISDVSHQGTDTFQKNSGNLSKINLFLSDGSNNRSAKLYYIEGTSVNYDPGYDGKLFGGVSHSFAVYSHLVSNDQGGKYQVQSLPNSDHENMIIPVGIIAETGKEITFTAEAMNLPSGLKVFLEDRENGVVTRLDEANANYSVTLNEALNGVGRFYLHTTSEALSTENIALEGVNVFTSDKNTLRVTGINSTNASIKIFNVLGKKVLDTSFSSKGATDINLPNLNTGVYIVQLASEKGKLNKKIVLN